MKSTTEKYVSLLPSEMEAPDVLAFLSSYVNAADKTHRHGFGCPIYLKRGIELAAGMARPPRAMDVTVPCLIEFGLPFLEGLPGVDSIRSAREKTLVSGSDSITFFETWAFKLNPYHEGDVMIWSRVHPDLATRCNTFARPLGLRKNTAASLAAMTALLQVPGLPDQLKRQFLGEVIAFGRKLQGRAREAAHILSRVRPDTAVLAVDLGDVLKEIRR